MTTTHGCIGIGTKNPKPQPLRQGYFQTCQLRLNEHPVARDSSRSCVLFQVPLESYQPSQLPLSSPVAGKGPDAQSNKAFKVIAREILKGFAGKLRDLVQFGSKQVPEALEFLISTGHVEPRAQVPSEQRETRPRLSGRFPSLHQSPGFIAV